MAVLPAVARIRKATSGRQNPWPCYPSVRALVYEVRTRFRRHKRVSWYKGVVVFPLFFPSHHQFLVHPTVLSELYILDFNH